MDIIVQFVLLFILWPVGLVVYRLCLDPLSRYPGPRWWAIWRGPWLFSTIRGTILTDLRALHENYGPVVRVAPDELSFITPQAADTIYRTRPEFPKDPMHLPPFDNHTPGILAADQDQHKRYRRFLSGAFSDKGMRAQQHTIQRHVNLLIQRLSERVGSGSQDICQWYNWTTFDIIGDLAFGETFGCLERGETHKWIASIQGNVKSIPIINAVRRFGLDWIIPLVAPKELLDMRRQNAAFTQEKVDRRRRHGGDRGDIWDGLIGGGDREEEAMSRDEMTSNASALVLAGSETSATLLSGCTWLLLRNPEHLRRVTSEVRGSFATDSEIDLVSVGKLEYMLAAMDEALRLYPPVPMQSNRIVVASGATVAGQWIPGMTSVAVQQFAACRSGANFHRAAEFRPERWLGAPEFAGDRRECCQPFSIGPRSCLGRQLAYAETRLILAKILWHFDLDLDHEKMGGGDWMANQRVWILWDKSPLWLHLQPRQRHYTPHSP